MAWCSVEWIKPSEKRFRTQIALSDGRVLKQELAGVQTREIRVRGCTQEEYTAVIRASEATDYIDNLQHQASEEITFGINVFNVQSSGQRKLAPGATDSGSYTYAANCT